MDAPWLQLRGQGHAGLNRFGRIACKGSVDVAKVSKLFPRWSEPYDLSLSEALLDLSLVLDTTPSNLWLTAKASMSGLSGEAQAKPFALKAPLELNVQATHDTQGVHVNKLSLSSPFVDVSGKSDTNQILRLTSTSNLGSTLEALSPLLPLRATELQGKLNTLFLIDYSPNDQLKVTSEVEAGGVTFAYDGRAWLQQADLDCELRTVLSRTTFKPDSLWIDRMALESEHLQFQASGTVTDPEKGPELKLSGHVEASSPWLSTVLEDLTGSPLRVEGIKRSSFALSSRLEEPLWPQAFLNTTFSTQMEIERLSGFGLELLSLEIPLTLANGVVEFPIHAKANGGTMSVQPHVAMDRSERVIFRILNTNLLNDVTLTPELAADLLGVIHPLFKNCVVEQGSMDLRMDHLSWPLGPQADTPLTFSGVLQLNDIVLRASGLLEQTLGLLRVSEQKLEVGSKRVSFTCQEGRIKCSPLKLRVGDYRAIVTGTMGLDQTLDYSVSFPITSELVGEQWTPYLKDVELRIPIKGTASRPLVDRRGFDRALGGLLQQGTRAVFEKTTTDLIKKIFE